MRGSRKKPTKKSPERSIFAGLLKCADCGSNLNYHFNQGNHDIKYFNCSNYNTGRSDCNATHYIRVNFLEQVVMQEFHRLTRFASDYEDDFVKAVIGHSMQEAETGRVSTCGQLELLTKPSAKGHRQERSLLGRKKAKKQRLGSYPKHLTMRFRLRVVAERRQWSSTASNSRLNRRLKLCIHF